MENKQVNMDFNPRKEECHYNPMYITVNGLPTEKPLESFSYVIIDFSEEPISVIDKMKPLQELENLRMANRQLEALILHFYQTLKLANHWENEGGVEAEYWAGQFKKHFNITKERYGPKR